MSYSPPKVTIDLDEYNQLLVFKQDLETVKDALKEDVVPYQEAMGAILKGIHRLNLPPHELKWIIDAPLTVDVIMRVSTNSYSKFNVHCEMKKID